VNIFLSRPTWIPDSMRAGIDNLYDALTKCGLTPQTVGTNLPAIECPMNEVIALMKECAGTIVLGIPQVVAASCVIKESEALNVELGTEWNHIEAGLSLALQKPTLVIKHQSVIRGVFDRGATASFLYEFDFVDPNWSVNIANQIQEFTARCGRCDPRSPTTVASHGSAETSPLSFFSRSHQRQDGERGRFEVTITNDSDRLVNIGGVKVIGHSASLGKDVVVATDPEHYTKDGHYPFRLDPGDSLGLLYSARDTFSINVMDEFWVRVDLASGQAVDSTMLSYKGARNG